MQVYEMRGSMAPWPDENSSYKPESRMLRAITRERTIQGMDCIHPPARRFVCAFAYLSFFWLIPFLCASDLAAEEPRIPLVAVTQLEAKGVSPSDASVLTDNISDELLKSGKVRVMERSQMDKILQEQGFQQSGTCDTSECAVQIGRLLGIERIVVGSVGKVGETYSLSIRMVDVGTGEVLASSRQNHRGAIDDVLQEVVPMVVQELTRSGSRQDDKAASTGDASVEEKKSGGVWWWTLGGVAVAGGAVAAYLLLASDEESSSTPPAGNAPQDDMVDVKVEAP